MFYRTILQKILGTENSNKYGDTIQLNGDSDITHRIEFMRILLNNTELKINHFDKLRQENLRIALAIFAVLITLSLQSDNSLKAAIVSAVLAIIMVIFLILELKLHMYSEGWQQTRINITEKLQIVINHPAKDLSFEQYDNNAEKLKFGWRTFLYLCLFLVVIFLVFAYLLEWITPRS